MKILLTAFACSPTTGSEGGVGWNYAISLANDNDVWLITDVTRQREIEQYSHLIPKRLRIYFYRPNWLKNLRMNSKTAFLIFHLWMMNVWRLASKLDREVDFDLCWHLTYGTFRSPSSLWRLGKPLVIGPVGGGETSPIALLDGMPVQDRIVEIIRIVVIYTATLVPGFSACYRNASIVIARTLDTKNSLPHFVREKTVICQEIGGWPQKKIKRDRSPGLKIMFAGRLLSLKGIHIAIAAFSLFLQKGGVGQLTIIGDGPREENLRGQAAREGLSSNEITFIKRLSREKLFDFYKSQDVLLFPSLHDSGGNVVIEAMSFGVVPICLDLGGPKCFVSDECGRVISTYRKSRKRVEGDIATALLEIQNHPELLETLSDNAWTVANQNTYELQQKKVTDIAFSVVTPNGVKNV